MKDYSNIVKKLQIKYPLEEVQPLPFEDSTLLFILLGFLGVSIILFFISQFSILFN